MRSSAVVVPALLTLAACTNTESAPIAPHATETARAVQANGIAGSATRLGNLRAGGAATRGNAAATHLLPRPSVASLAGARSVVLPAAYASIMGEAENTYPHAWRDMRYQQAFLESEMGGLRALRRLCLRRDEVYGGPEFTQHLTVKLGPTLLAPLALTRVFDANYSAPPTEVFSGDVVLPESHGGGTLDDFYICIDFTRPYLHPAGANMIVEVVNTSAVFNVHFEDFCNRMLPYIPGDPAAGCTTNRVYAYSATATVAEPPELWQAGLVMKFEEARPSTRADCMGGGWANYGFANLGLCIRYVMTGR